MHDNWHGPHASASSDGTEKPKRRWGFRRRSAEQAEPAAASETETGPITGTAPGTGGEAGSSGPPPPGSEASPFDSGTTHTRIIQQEQRPGSAALRSREMRAYVASDERIVLQQRRHAITLAEPILTSVVVLVLVALLSSQAGDASNLRLVFFLIWLWFAIRAVLRVADWWVRWFVITDKRVMQAQGVIDRKIGMLPLARVTDMSYTKPFWGRIFRYGRFVFESAGQDQALREIEYVRHPDVTYGTIIRELFGNKNGD